MSLSHGHKLAHYEILEPIGAGVQGEVYRARDTKLGREIAIKVLPEEFARDKERLDRFEREARLLAELNHANIATLHGLEEHDGQQFLVMELVEGETLAERIAIGSAADPTRAPLNQGLGGNSESMRDVSPLFDVLDLRRFVMAESFKCRNVIEFDRRQFLKGASLGAGGILLATACRSSTSDEPAPQTTPMTHLRTPPFVGAWQWLADGYDGRPTMTETHFCYAFAQNDRQPPTGENPSEAEAAALFRSFGGSAAGTLTAEQAGDEWLLEYVTQVELWPANVGQRTRWAFSVQGDRMRGQIIGADETRTPDPPFAYRRLSELGSSPVAGTWELVSKESVGLMIMTDTEYRYITTRKDRPSVTGEASELSDADAAVLYHSFDAQCGSHTVSGSTLLRQPAVVKDPRDKGREISIEFAINGDKLTTRRGQRELSWRKA